MSTGIESADLAELRAGLAQRAAVQGLLDVAWETAPSPYGDVIVCSTEAGVVRVVLPAEDADAALHAVARVVSPRILRSPGRTDAARRQLTEYFEGERTRFDIPVDWRLATGFRLKALTAVAALAYGATATYKQIATAIGTPGAVRAAGSACANNPLPVIVPCHRVVRTDGAVGQYLGGVDMKLALLSLEAQTPRIRPADPR